MKPTNTISTAFYLFTMVFAACAESLLPDGDFESLPVGTAPDVGWPAGNWMFYDGGYAESADSQFTIAPAPAGGTGNCLQLMLSSADIFNTDGMHLYNTFETSVTKESGRILYVSFDVYVAPARGGGSVHLGFGSGYDARGPQLTWYPSGALRTRNPSGDRTLISSYPRGVWQRVQIEINLARARWNFYWSEKGQPVSVTRTNLAFRSPFIFDYFDRVNVVQFNDLGVGNIHSYFDNFVATTNPPPQLSVERSADGVRLFWPLSATGYFLEQTELLTSPTTWSPVLMPYETNAADMSVTVPIRSGTAFYRLRRP